MKKARKMMDLMAELIRLHSKVAPVAVKVSVPQSPVKSEAVKPVIKQIVKRLAD
jgi:DNA-binding ferritin-like protein